MSIRCCKWAVVPLYLLAISGRYAGVQVAVAEFTVWASTPLLCLAVLKWVSGTLPLAYQEWLDRLRVTTDPRAGALTVAQEPRTFGIARWRRMYTWRCDAAIRLLESLLALPTYLGCSCPQCLNFTSFERCAVSQPCGATSGESRNIGVTCSVYQ